MSTPVLSKKQQKKALLAKKGSAKGLRNVLAQPYEFSWPILKDENADGLKLLIHTSMPAVKRTSPNIPWSKLYKMKKAERKTARDEARLKQNIIPPDESIKNSIVMGVNGTTRLLEKNDASCVLLEANVDSMFFLKHIVIMANSKNIPCLVVPFLKDVMLETVSIRSAAVALKKIVAQTEDHHFHELYKKVAELASSLEKSEPVKLDFKVPNISSLTVEESSNIAQSACSKKEPKLNDSFTLSMDVYKYRSSRKERCFIPTNSMSSEIAGESEDSNFISVGEDTNFTVSDDKYRANEEKIRRYVDIHKKDDENSPEEKIQMEGDNILMNPNAKYSVSSENETCDMDGEVLYETKSAVLGMTEPSLLNLAGNQLIKNNTKSSEICKYQSLKVKRLQGNPKRVKATKVPKKRKK